MSQQSRLLSVSKTLSFRLSQVPKSSNLSNEMLFLRNTNERQKIFISCLPTNNHSTHSYDFLFNSKNISLCFVSSDVSVSRNTPERTASRSTFHVCPRHPASMAEHAYSIRVTIPTSANVHQVRAYSSMLFQIRNPPLSSEISVSDEKKRLTHELQSSQKTLEKRRKNQVEKSHVVSWRVIEWNGKSTHST